MGPKKQVARKLKQSLFEALEARRTRAQTSGTSTQREESSRPTIESSREEEQATKNLGNETPPPQSTLTETMATRTIAMGRKINFGFFQKYKFPMSRWIEAMGWKNFCTIDLTMYPNLMREFYKNLKRGSREIASTIKGVEFDLTGERIG